MADVKDGGPVYPQDFPMKSGMSLRDYFAGQALAGLLSNDPLKSFVDDADHIHDVHGWLAKGSYEIADAMLKAREVTHG
jgi:hypothetical protein